MAEPSSFAEATAPGATCEECGYRWSIPTEEARALISAAPDRYRSLLEGRSNAKAKPAPDRWSPTGYVWHVADALRVWAERIWGLRHDPDFEIVPFDQDELARVRGYDLLSPAAGLWSLERAVSDWDSALDGADVHTSVDHPEFGRGTLTTVIDWIGHEVHHHDLDIRRGLGLPDA